MRLRDIHITIRNKYSSALLDKNPVGKIVGMAIWPFILLHTQLEDPERTENHEKIHLVQQLELLFIGFAIWYTINFLYKYCVKQFSVNKAYMRTIFEREAYMHEDDPDYLKTRRLWSFLKY